MSEKGESTMSDMYLLIQEVARLALQNAAMTEHIAQELDVHTEELQQLGAYLERVLNLTN